MRIVECFIQAGKNDMMVLHAADKLQSRFIAIRRVFVVCLLSLLGACHSERTSPSALSTGKELGKVDSRLKEASGLVASINNPGMLWTINDAGNPPEVFLIDERATIRMVCTLSKIQNRDWEDIAIAAGPDGKNYLYIADIGDNNSKFRYKFIYRFEEPVLTVSKEKTITKFDTLCFKMPDGKRDAETVLIDPVTNDLFIISKREPAVGLYRAPNPLRMDTMTLEKVLKLPFTKIVAGSISPDGNHVLLKNYTKVFYWKKSGHETLVQLLATPPRELLYEQEAQGEAIAWSRDGAAFYTLSESTRSTKARLIMHSSKESLGIK